MAHSVINWQNKTDHFDSLNKPCNGTGSGLKMKFSIKQLVALAVPLLWLIPTNTFANKPLKVHVSILPQKYFAERIGKEREDTIIGTLWAVGMAVGILLNDFTPGYFNLSSYLFGDLFLISDKDLLLLILTALTVVLLVRIVGIVLVIALLTIPPAIASFYSRRLWHMMLTSILFCAAFTWTGLGASYSFSLSSGPTIFVLSGAIYLILILCHKWAKN